MCVLSPDYKKFTLLFENNWYLPSETVAVICLILCVGIYMYFFLI